MRSCNTMTCRHAAQGEALLHVPEVGEVFMREALCHCYYVILGNSLITRSLQQCDAFLQHDDMQARRAGRSTAARSGSGRGVHARGALPLLLRYPRQLVDNALVAAVRCVPATR